MVREMVSIHGPKQWSEIASKIPGREGKQCRERWLNHLRPDLRKADWTQSEVDILLQQHARLGNQWVEIARHLPGRTDNSVKNYWNSRAMRQTRAELGLDDATSGLAPELVSSGSGSGGGDSDGDSDGGVVGGVLQPLSLTAAHEKNGQNRSATRSTLQDGEVLGSSKTVKRPWTKEEDDVVREMVSIHGPKQWSEIASKIPGREGKQCRERWLNHLRPDLRKADWTQSEVDILLQQHARLGNQWVEIARHLPGRTDNSVKNYWNSHAMRQHRSRALQSAGKAAEVSDPTVRTPPATNAADGAVAASSGAKLISGLSHTASALVLRDMMSAAPQLSANESVADAGPKLQLKRNSSGLSVDAASEQCSKDGAAIELKRQRCTTDVLPVHQSAAHTSDLDQQATAWLLGFAGCL